MTRPLTRSELLALAATTDIVTGGRAFGLGRTASYELAQNGNFPCQVIKTGGTYRVITADLLRVLQITPEDGDGARGPALTPLAETHSSTT